MPSPYISYRHQHTLPFFVVYMCVFYLGFAAGGRVEVVGRIAFGEGDGLVASKRVCHSDEAAREATDRSLKLDGFLWGGEVRVFFGKLMTGTQQ